MRVACRTHVTMLRRTVRESGGGGEPGKRPAAIRGALPIPAVGAVGGVGASADPTARRLS